MIHFPDLRRRVETEQGFYIEPPLDNRWPPLTKLRWLAATVRVACPGLEIDIYEQPRPQRFLERVGQRAVGGEYGVTFGVQSMASFTFDETWILICGIQAGWEAARW